MKKQKVSDAVIHRLPRYYRYLDELHNKGVVRISSNSLGQKMDITASQIRQDLSCFGEFGQQGYGYNVAELRSEIGHILGIDSGYRLIVVGAGHLGHALLQNFDFQKVGFQVDTAFDVSPALIGTKIHDVTIRPMEELEHYVEEYHPNVAVLTVPQSVAQPLGPAHCPGSEGLLELYQCGALHPDQGGILRGHPLCGYPPDPQLPYLPAGGTLLRVGSYYGMRPAGPIFIGGHVLMCNQNSCFGGCGCWIIIAIIILCLFWGGNGCGCGNTQNNNGCGCGC